MTRRDPKSVQSVAANGGLGGGIHAVLWLEGPPSMYLNHLENGTSIFFSSRSSLVSRQDTGPCPWAWKSDLES